MSSPLHLDVFVVPYKADRRADTPMGKGEPTLQATSVSLITGKRDAVLIDAGLTTRTGFRCSWKPAARVFAGGDVLSGSVKRAATAIG
jgi:hypothetical protein